MQIIVAKTDGNKVIKGLKLLNLKFNFHALLKTAFDIYDVLKLYFLFRMTCNAYVTTNNQ